MSGKDESHPDKESFHTFINTVFRNVNHESIERAKQEALDKGWIKSYKTPFGEIVYWDHENLPKFSNHDEKLAFERLLCQDDTYFDCDRLIKQKRKALGRKFNRETNKKLFGFDKIFDVMTLEKIKANSTGIPDLIDFFSEKWGQDIDSRIVQTFEIPNDVWMKLYVLLFHRGDKDLNVECTQVVLEVEHAMGIAVFVNKDYK